MHHAKQDTPAPEASRKHPASAPAGGSSSSPDQYNYPSLKQGQHKQGQHSTSEPGSMPIRHKPHTSKDRAPSTDYYPASEQYTHKPDYYKEQAELDYPGTFKHKEPTSEHKQSSPDHEDDEPAYKPKSNTHYKPKGDEPAYEPKPYTGKHTPSQKYKPQEPRRYEPEHQDNEQEPYKPEHTQYEPEQYSLKYTDHTDNHAPSPQYTHPSDPHPHNPSNHDAYSTDHAPSTGYPPLSEQYQHTADRYKKDHGEPGLHKYDEHPSTGYHAPSAQYKPVHHPREQPYHPSYRYYPDAMQDNLDHDYSPNSENYKQTFKPPRSHPVQHDHHAAPPVYPEPSYKLTHPYPAQPPPYQAPVYRSYRGSHDQWPYAKQYPGSPGEQYYKQYYPDEPYYKQYSPSEQYHKPAEPGPPPVITCSPGYGVASTGGVVKCERCPGETFSAGVHALHCCYQAQTVLLNAAALALHSKQQHCTARQVPQLCMALDSTHAMQPATAEHAVFCVASVCTSSAGCWRCAEYCACRLLRSAAHVAHAGEFLYSCAAVSYVRTAYCGCFSYLLRYAALVLLLLARLCMEWVQVAWKQCAPNVDLTRHRLPAQLAGTSAHARLDMAEMTPSTAPYVSQFACATGQLAAPVTGSESVLPGHAICKWEVSL
jgi:hypothetical protein